jgi:hypothetical protein
MARTRSLEDLIADVRQRVNLETSTFCSDAEITEWLNQELAEVHMHLVTAEGQPHFRTQLNIAVVNGTALYALPSDFYRLQRLIALVDGRFYDLEPFMEGERAQLLNSQIYSYVARAGGMPMYRIQAGNLEILPAVRTYTAQLFYIQRSPRLAAPTDAVDGFDGYEIAAINGACAIASRKEESDPSMFLEQKMATLRLIDAMADKRDASHPERVTDVTGALDSPWMWR